MRILSGIQPTGPLHLGNYFGMMKPAIEFQSQGECFYFIADLHALTTVRNAADLARYSREAARDFLACGLDVTRTRLFLQSDIPEVPAMAWLLATLAPMGLLQRCHSYKDKTAQGLPASVGLFTYPILMAADILIYDSDIVPVGKDQKQHLEVTQDLATKFNEAFGPTLKIPQPSIREATAIVPGLDGRKMSKSYGNTISLFEEEKTLRKKIMGIPTDSTPVEAPKPMENSTILGLYRLVASAEEVQKMEEEFRLGGVGYGEFKKRLFEAVRSAFQQARERREAISEEDVHRVLREGAEAARAVAAGVLERCRKAVGLLGRFGAKA